MQSLQITLNNFGLSSFNWLDFTFLFIVIISTLISLVRGFVREAISVITWIVAFWVALKCSSWLSFKLTTIIHQETFRHIAAITILLVLVLIFGMLVAHCADSLIKKGKLSGLDRLLGAVFGAFRGFMIISLLLFFGHVLVLNNTSWWKSSKTIKYFKEPVEWLQSNIPNKIEQISMLVFLDNT
jgi:membrane protein required for colicin V production